jgi:uncharacterized phage-associated protein
MKYKSFNIPVTEVAEYFLSKVNTEFGDSITNLKLQKLVYFAQGFVLAITGKTLFNENLIAWQHGPVVISLYDKYKNGANAIDIPETFNLPHLCNNDELIDILDDVYNTYGQFSAWKLREMSHLPGAPWDKAEINQTLNLDDMYTYFKGLLIA